MYRNRVLRNVVATRRRIVNRQIVNHEAYGDHHHPARRLGPPTLAALLGVGAVATGLLLGTGGAAAGPPASVPVEGTGIHHFTSAVVHSQEQTPTGMIQRSTDIVSLSGDLNGRILYHPTSVFDFTNNTLVNTGTQVFSGTVLGSDPVILHDDRFRFEVDLATGATTGQVHLSRAADAPHPGSWYDCDLEVTGRGQTADGDATFDYTGTCMRRGQP
jgi:hypothetical protein